VSVINWWSSEAGAKKFLLIQTGAGEVSLQYNDGEE